MATQRNEPRVFFPWEKRRGVRSLFARSRARQALIVAACVGFFLLLRSRDRGAARERSTRAEITTVTLAIAAWRADHDRACPAALSDLVAGGYLHSVPRDAWGHPLRVTCPGRRDPEGFDVSSDGPDGDPWGTDRVE
jgi:general secretion pathway protein G